MKTLTIGSVRPTIWLSAKSGMPATCPPTTIGIPIAPQATGAVLASRQMDAA
ncbi:MAG: hypothetical protein AW09_003014 [Candidatus Accumulibacter phosphatis]|uniref:Uncharacterized protein n=1 Tax=Candidatus Accumulibacter phosphatis TaxID=327160 RepID=A0A080M3Z4_9PROT|nr:MAG: hypothetical protein AW09_003014 [Candidatus Accumulibacter phosphatis]